MKKELKKYNQQFKIFGRKKGRKSKEDLKSKILSKYLLNTPSDLTGKKIILDIGSGNGENTLFLSKKYSNYLIIAVDIYRGGHINLCKELNSKKIDNVKIFNQNILILFEKFNFNNLISEVWILFPDPWPKTKHNKRRLINYSFIEKISFFLEQNKKIYIVIDCATYFISILKIFYNSKSFKWINDLPYEWDYRIKNVSKTRYFEKSLRNNRKSILLIFQRI